MLGILNGIASVMIIVSVVNGSNQKMMEYYESMGTNKINVSAYSWNGRDMFKDIYDYCLGLDEYVAGVTPQACACLLYTSRQRHRHLHRHWPRILPVQMLKQEHIKEMLLFSFSPPDTKGRIHPAPFDNKTS